MALRRRGRLSVARLVGNIAKCHARECGRPDLAASRCSPHWAPAFARSDSRIRIPYLPGPLCLIRARRQCRARCAGCSLRSQTLTPARGSGSWFPWSLLREAGLPGRLRSAKTMDTKRHVGTAQSPRSGRSAAEQPRSGLTATGRCGRRPKMCESRSPQGGRESPAPYLSAYGT